MKTTKQKKWIWAIGLSALVLSVSGCRTFNYYGQAISGQVQILARQKSVEKFLKDSRTPADVRERLELIGEMRAFAATELKLAVDGHYTTYADLGREAVVYNVQAAPEFSLAPKGWWYPFVGRLEYQGYFSRKRAEEYARLLERKGYDVYVGDVTAYSTLGYFKDPILNTFAFDPEPALAETLFHELAHLKAFAPGDTDFNEAFATTVGEEGARRWLAARNPSVLPAYELQLQRTREWVKLVMQTRSRLAALYGDRRDEDGNFKSTGRIPNTPRNKLGAEKARILAELREQYRVLKSSWGGAVDYDDWFDGRLNNAQINSIAAYYELVPAFEALLEMNGKDLESFYLTVKKLGRVPQEHRRERLRFWAGIDPEVPPETSSDPHADAR